MTAGLQGSGTEVDPWLITSRDEFAAVVRDAAASGYYRVVASLDTGTYQQLDPYNGSIVSTYAPKVIDMNGYTVRLTGAVSTAFLSLFGSTIFKRGTFILNYGPQNGMGLTLFYQCGLEDCAVYLYVFSSNSSADLTVINTSSGPSSLEPMLLKRVVFAGGSGIIGSVDYVYTPILITSGLQVSHAYVRSSKTAWSSAGFTLQTDLSLSALDAASGGVFTGEGWWADGNYVLPYQTDQVGLVVNSFDSGEAKSRRIWLESSGRFRLLGDTGSDGVGSFSDRIKKRASFSLVADEQLFCDELHDYKVVVSGFSYLPPLSNGYIYTAGSSGALPSLDGVIFNDQVVVVGGVSLTPRPHYAPAISGRLSVARQGLSGTVVMDNASGGGGGPVIDGDPAFLEGAVEEVNPMTGLRRALANCEVIAFEKRGTDYVAMGSTYSDGIGGFRLETQVYGGGDVFAFAADFPGVIFQPGVALNVGDRIRPALANGYVYEITEAGTAGAEEPVWWPDQGDGTEGDIGTARARARPYYQPVGHGPLKMTLI